MVVSCGSSADNLSMKALVFDGDHLVLDTNHAEPKPSDGEAVIRPLKVGICSTDLEIRRGYMGFQGVLGHEFVGIVESVNVQGGTGSEARSLLGKRVVGSINAVCGDCDMCRRGLVTHCRNRTVLGIDGRPGCFAELFSLPVKNLILVPDHVDDDEAVFAEPLAAALHGGDPVELDREPLVTVLGDGRLGLLTAQALSLRNRRVRLVGKHVEKMNLCEKWGIKHRHVDSAGKRGDQDVVIDCTGSPSGLETAMKMVRPRGMIILKTTHAPVERVTDLSPIVIHEITVIGSRCGNLHRAVEVLGKHQVDVLSLITRRYRFTDALDAFRAAEQPGVIKILMEM